MESSFLLSFVIILIATVAYLWLDFKGPKTISVKHVQIFGMSCLKAPDLIIQEKNMENIIATRGMKIYYSDLDEYMFVKKGHINVGFSIFWLYNFSLVRKYFRKPECLEVVISSGGDICAFSGGFFLAGNIYNGKIRKTFKLPNFGFGKGRGILSNGILKTDSNIIFFGEYFRNDDKQAVRIFKSADFGFNWEIAHEFKPGEIRHIHALQQDPYTSRLWICTGDNNNESIIGWSDNDFKTIYPIGQGSQIWRACQLVFTNEALYWGTDTESYVDAGIYRMDRVSLVVTKLKTIRGAIFFGTILQNETIILTSDREGYEIEEDFITRAYVIRDGVVTRTIPFGTWDYRESGLRSNYAKLRLQRGHGDNALLVSCLNQKELSDGDLLIIPEETIIKYDSQN